MPYSPDLGAGVLRALQTAFPNSWGTAAEWRWKQPDRPGFTTEDVWVAVASDSAAVGTLTGTAEVVGCYSTSVFPVRLGDGLTVLFSYDGDLAVTPAGWGRDVPSAIRDASERWFLGGRAPHRVALRGGFTTPKLNARVYGPLYGLTFVPDTTTEFRKALGLAPLQRHVQALGARVLADPRISAALARGPLVLNLSVAGLEDAHVIAAATEFRLERGHATGADLAVRVPPSVLVAAREGERVLARTLAREAARGRVRIGGLARGAVRLTALIWGVMRAA